MSTRPNVRLSEMAVHPPEPMPTWMDRQAGKVAALILIGTAAFSLFALWQIHRVLCL